MPAAPTYRPGQSPDVLAKKRADRASLQTPEQAALSQRIQQLPSYQRFTQSLLSPGSTGQGVGGTEAYKDLVADLKRLGIEIPEGEVVDTETGDIRSQDWVERHPILTAVLVTAGFAGGGAAIGALAAGGGAAAGAGAGAASGSGAGVAGGAGATGAGVGIGETGAVSGLAGSGFGAGGGVGAAGVGGAGVAGAATLPSSTIAPLATTLPAGSAGSGAVGAGATAGGGSTLGAISKLAKAGNTARDLGGAVSNASSAAGANRRTDAQIGQSAQRTYESALMDRAKTEADQRKEAAKDVYRASFFRNEQTGPYSAKPQAKLSPEYMDSLASLEQQGSARLKQPRQYDTTQMKPLVEKEIDPATGLEKTGSWVGPTLSTIGSLVASYYGGK